MNGLYISAAVAFAASTTLTWLTVRLCHARGWLVYPRSDRWAQRAVAPYGGAAFSLVFLFAAMLGASGQRFSAILALTGVAASIGLVDDVRHLSPKLKLVLQIALAIAAVLAGVVYPLRSWELLNAAFTVIWIVAITNAFNLLDNMDGLSAGIAVIAAVNIALFMSGTQLAVICWIFAAAVAGFLLFNFNPARIFMGDTGSLAIGFFLACASVMAAEKLTSTASVLFVPMLTVFIPIFDTALVSITRRISGRAISAGAKDHTSHRLVLLGMSERKAVLILYAFSGLGGLVAYLWRNVFIEAGPGLVILFLIGAGLFWLYLADLRLPAEWLSNSSVSAWVLPDFLLALTRRSAIMLLDAAMILVALYLAWILRFEQLAGGVATYLFIGTVAIVVKVPILTSFSVYRRGWRLHSLQEFYTIVQASVVSFLLLVTALTYVTRFHDLSRAVFVIDLVLTVALLSITRMGKTVFDDMLHRKRPSSGVLAVGGEWGPFLQRYLEWHSPDVEFAGIVLPRNTPEATRLAIPALNEDEAKILLVENRATGVYLLPDSRPDTRDVFRRLAEQFSVPVFELQLNAVEVNAAARKPEAPAPAAAVMVQ